MAARRVVLVIILCLFRPGCILSTTRTRTHTRTRVSVPPRFDDGSLPPRRVSTGRRFEPRPFSTFTYLLRPLVTPPPWPLAYRPWNSRRIGKYSICTRGETSPRPTVYICNTWSDAGQRRVHRPRPMFPFFPSTVPGRLASCNLLWDWKANQRKGTSAGCCCCSPVDSRNRITFKAERILFSVFFFSFAGNETEILWRLINYRCVRDDKEDGMRVRGWECVPLTHEGGSARFLARHLHCSSKPAHLTLLLII